MPTDLADDDYFKNYIKYIKTDSLTDLIQHAKSTRQYIYHVAVKRQLLGIIYFHHFILNIVLVNDREYKLNILQKTTGNIAYALSIEAIAKIRFDEFKCKFNDSSKQFVTSSKCKNLLDFSSGVYLLGDYDNKTRELAYDKGKILSNKKELYSIESSNCEHFVNWCFIGNSISYQVPLLKKRLCY